MGSLFFNNSRFWWKIFSLFLFLNKHSRNDLPQPGVWWLHPFSLHHCHYCLTGWKLPYQIALLWPFPWSCAIQTSQRHTRAVISLPPGQSSKRVYLNQFQSFNGGSVIFCLSVGPKLKACAAALQHNSTTVFEHPFSVTLHSSPLWKELQLLFSHHYMFLLFTLRTGFKVFGGVWFREPKVIHVGKNSEITEA